MTEKDLTLKQIRPITELRNWTKNPRGIKDKDFGRLKDQIKKLGQYKPLLITPDGEVLGGNMRLRAYRDLGISDVWVSVVEPKTEAEKLEYALSDNDRVGYYEDDKLAELISQYKDEIDLGKYSVDLGKTTDLQTLLDQFSPVVEDDVPEVDDTPSVSKLGDVYQLGRHRLMCGDSTKREDVEKLMGGKKADMVLCDPPYGINYKYEDHPSGNYKDGFTDEEYRNFYRQLVNMGKRYSKEDAANYWWFDQSRLEIIWEAIGRVKYKELLVWSKDLYPYKKGNSKFCADYELCYYFFNKEPYWTGDAFTRAVLNYATVHSFARRGKEDTGGVSSVHPTQKPTELFGRLIELSSKNSDTIIDFCGGSGSTLIACEQTNRICYMMELDEKYCDVIRRRYAKFIGKEDEWKTITPKL
jgi:DNA modification methylase